MNYNKSFHFSKLGFGYVDRNITMNAWIVTGLYKGSNAEIAGLEIDDKTDSERQHPNKTSVGEIENDDIAFWDNLNIEEYLK